MQSTLEVSRLSRPVVASAVPRTRISPNLDLLRAIAVLCVLVSHLFSALGYRNLGSLGRFGVVLFFIHTSLVLMASLDRMSTVGSGWKLAAAFWVRRIFRIYPLSVFFVLLVVLFHIPADPALIYSWIGVKAFVSNLALTQNLTYSDNILAPLWSLPLEVQMYGFLPFAYFIVRKGRYRSLALWVLAVPLAIFIPEVTARLSVFLYAPCFLSGVVAFDLLREKRVRRLPAWLWPLGIVLAILLFGPADNISLGHKLYRAWALSLGLAVLYVNTDEIANRRSQPALHWIAEHSYGIYLSHIVLIWVALHKLHTAWASTLFLVVTLPVVPELLYRVIEHPLTLAGAHLSRRVLREDAILSGETGR
jgi:peptidoglycan/LPS O-acetylase OafA/YrhL